MKKVICVWDVEGISAQMKGRIVTFFGGEAVITLEQAIRNRRELFRIVGFGHKTYNQLQDAFLYKYTGPCGMCDPECRECCSCEHAWR